MFGKTIKLFKLLGFQVQADVSWFILAVLVIWSLAKGYFPYRYEDLAPGTYWIMGAFGTIGLFLSIVLHELGHSLVSRKHGLPMKGITLFIFGGVAEMNEEPPSARSEFLMAITGPAVSIALGVLFFVVYWTVDRMQWPDTVAGVFQYLGFINLLLAVFNMLPAFPLDGGRVLRSFLWQRKGSLRRATFSASKIGSGFGALLIGLGVLSILFGSFISGMWWFLIGMFLRNAARSSFVQLEIRDVLKGEPIERFMSKNPVIAPANISIDELVHDYFYKYHFHMFPVVQDSEVLGCISTREVKKISREKWALHSVREMMVPCSEENTVSPETDAMDVLSILQRIGASRLMVMDGNKLIGVISLKDLLQFLALKLDLEGAGGSGYLKNGRFLSSNE
jgi:Zn-dependent protease/predicted transcriptional regulator